MMEMLENTNLLAQFEIPEYILGILDSLSCGGFLLDLGGQVLSLNMLAFGCLGDGLMLRGAHLSAIERGADQRFQQLVRSALGTRDMPVQMSMAVQRSDRLPLMVLPFRLEQRAPPPVGPASLLLVVLDPERWPEPRQEMLTQVFGLTRAEAEVAIGIVSGRSLAKIATGRGIKIGTVRAHLKTVFAKTHTSGQADLSRVLTRLALLVPQTPRKVPSASLGEA